MKIANFFLGGSDIDWNTFPLMDSIDQIGWKSIENLIVSRLQTNYKSAVVLFSLRYDDEVYEVVPMAMEAQVHYYDANDKEVCVVKSAVSNVAVSKKN